MSTHSLEPRGFTGLAPARRLRFTTWPAAGLLLAASLLVLLAVSRADSVPAPAAGGAGALSFVPNVGQTDDRVRFAAHAEGASFYFTEKDAVLAFERGDEGLALRLDFVGASPATAIEGEQARAGTVNYLVGSDAAKWQTGIPTYGEVVYRELWPGIDMVFRGANGTLKYEFVVQPGADPSRIGLAYRGADGLALSGAGQLLIQTPWGTLRDDKPRSYQLVDGRRVPVESSFALDDSAGTYGFAVGAYDPTRPLVIDPGLVYSTYLGGNGHDEAINVATDADGSAYVTGFTSSTDFPARPGAFDTSYGGNSDAYVTKLDFIGRLVYSTFLGGAGSDGSATVAVDGLGRAYVGGSTTSADFPTTPGALRTTKGAFSDAFVTRLSADGSSLSYSTYLGAFGNSHVADLALDSTDAAVVVGGTSQSGFPTTAGAFDETINGLNDGFVAKLNPTGSAFVYSTYLGGNECDLEQPSGVALDSSGNAYVTGYTSAENFPTTPGAFDTTGEGCTEFSWDVYVTKLNPTGSSLLYSTFLNGESGGSDTGFGVAVDEAGSAYVVGATESADFPTTPGAFDGALGGNIDGYVTKLNAAGSALVFSTFLGGSGPENAVAVALRDDGRVYVSGGSGSDDFPTTAEAFDESANGSDDAFLAALDGSGAHLLYGSYYGGTAGDYALWGLEVDPAGAVVFAGYTESEDNPISLVNHDSEYGGLIDGWVAKLIDFSEMPDSDGDGIPDDQDIEPIRDRIAALIAASPASPAADKLEDSLAKVDSAIAKLAAGDRQGALGELEGAVGDVQAAVNGRNLDTTVGTELMRDIAAFARIIATQAIDAAKARNGDGHKIAEAEAARAQGDARVTVNRFKEAVGKYKDAVAKAEGA